MVGKKKAINSDREEQCVNYVKPSGKTMGRAEERKSERGGAEVERNIYGY